MNSIKKSFQFGSHQVTIETSEIARQADGAVLVSMDDTTVLLTAVGAREAREGEMHDFGSLLKFLPPAVGSVLDPRILEVGGSGYG